LIVVAQMYLVEVATLFNAYYLREGNHKH